MYIVAISKTCTTSFDLFSVSIHHPQFQENCQANSFLFWTLLIGEHRTHGVFAILIQNFKNCIMVKWKNKIGFLSFWAKIKENELCFSKFIAKHSRKLTKVVLGPQFPKCRSAEELGIWFVQIREQSTQKFPLLFHKVLQNKKYTVFRLFSLLQPFYLFETYFSFPVYSPIYYLYLPRFEASFFCGGSVFGEDVSETCAPVVSSSFFGVIFILFMSMSEKISANSLS